MRFVVEIKNPSTNEIVETKEFKSILQLAKDINESYHQCHKNYMYFLNENEKKARKFAQIIFDNKYRIYHV